MVGNTATYGGGGAATIGISTAGSYWVDSTTSTSSGTAATFSNIGYYSPRLTVDAMESFKLVAGKQSIGLPDGANLEIDELGNYRIDDKEAKVTYRANRIREFSPHLNASDVLAQFVKYVGSLGVKQGEVLSLPLELFVNWLIIEAAERDKDPVPLDVVPVDRHREFKAFRSPKCLACGRYVPRFHAKNRFPFCNPDHGGRWVNRNRLNALAPAN